MSKKDKDNKNGKQEHSDVLYMPIFMSIGISVGLALGVAFDNVPVAMCIGLCVGLCVGTMLDAVNRSKKNADTNENGESDNDTSEE